MLDDTFFYLDSNIIKSNNNIGCPNFLNVELFSRIEASFDQKAHQLMQDQAYCCGLTWIKHIVGLGGIGEFDISDPSELCSKLFDFGVKGFSRDIGASVVKIIEYSWIVIGC